MRFLDCQCFEQRFVGMPVSAAEKADLAAGFIAGLRAQLGLRDRESALVAYAYTLMAGERAGAAASSLPPPKTAGTTSMVKTINTPATWTELVTAIPSVA